MKFTFKILGLLIVTIVTFVIFISVMGLLILQSKPQFQKKNIVNVEAATQSKTAAKRVLTSIKNKKQPVFLTLSQTEINGLNALLNRAAPQITSDVIIANNSALINLSIELPLPSALKYLNISGYLYSSSKGIDLSKINIGGLSLSGNKLVAVGSWFVDTFIQDKLGTNIVSMVQWVTLSDTHISTSLIIPKEMNAAKEGKSGLLALRDNLAFYGDVNKIQYYHNYLAHYLEHLENPATVNRKVSFYIQLMFTVAKEQTLKNLIKNNKRDAVKENYYALMALALYFGSDSFELLVGDVSKLTDKQLSKRYFLMNKVTLSNRVDLQKHFMYSVALQFFSDTAASDAIGELKEFLDSNPGGSGFSFADLMADRAGTRLAEFATRSEATALYAQYVLSKNIDESVFMPNIGGIPEGISAELFNSKYRDVGSKEYKKMMMILDEKLAGLALYN